MTSLTETVEVGELRRTDSAWPMPGLLRRVLLLAPPLLLAGLEILHPQPDETTEALMDASTWFAGFHVIQLALIGLVGLSVLLLADSFGRTTTRRVQRTRSASKLTRPASIPTPRGR